MKRLLAAIRSTVASRALPPLVFGFFLLLYIGVAFFTDETLITLMALTRNSVILAAILALLPLNGFCRLVAEAAAELKRRRALSGKSSRVEPELYDEAVELVAPASWARVEERLSSEGYDVTLAQGGLLAARRGGTLFPVRMLYLVGMCCLFSGILVSLVSRGVNRQAVVEGAPFPTPSGNGGMVEKISYGRISGLILEKSLIMEVAGSDEQGGQKFGIYPPGRFRGAFVYPRYLGIALSYRLSSPDLPGGAEERTALLPLYPPGKEAATKIVGTPYRLNLTLGKSQDGSDPYVTGKMTFLFKLLKGQELLLTGSIPSGGEFVRDGYRLAIPDSRRMVMTDFVYDSGVLLIWVAGVLCAAALLLWIPLRIFFPRREMLFKSEGELVRAFSRAEGGRKRHAGVFHELLDLLEVKEKR